VTAAHISLFFIVAGHSGLTIELFPTIRQELNALPQV